MHTWTFSKDFNIEDWGEHRGYKNTLISRRVYDPPLVFRETDNIMMDSDFEIRPVSRFDPPV